MTYFVYVTERHRTPLGKFAAWFYSRLAGTFLEGYFSFLFTGSWVFRYSLAIVVGIILGGIIDFSFHLWGPNLQGGACAVLGAIVGACAAGGRGLPIGAFWGWLIGGLTDTITSQMISNPASTIPSKAISWLVTCLVAWWVGVAVSRGFERIAQRWALWKVILSRAAVLVTILSMLVVLVKSVAWLSDPLRLSLSFLFKWCTAHYLLVLVVCWSLTALIPVYWFLSWAAHKAWLRSGLYSNDPWRPRHIEEEELRYMPRLTFLDYMEDECSRLGIAMWCILLFASLLLTGRLIGS